MPTCRDVITLALRLGKVAGISGTPTASEVDLGLTALQSFYLDMVANGMFGQLADVVTSVPYTVKPGQRVRVLGSAAITYPTQVDEGCASFPPYDLSLVETFDVASSTRSLRLFEAGRGAWVELCNLGLSDEAPLATRGVVGLAATFATSGAFLVCFSSVLDPNLAPAVRTFRTGLIGKAGGDRQHFADDYA